MAVQRELGEHFYLFQDDDRTPTEHLLIYAHGGYYRRAGLFRIPAFTNLYFYAPDRASLMDMNPRNFMQVVGGQPHYEMSPPPESVRNYELGEFIIPGGVATVPRRGTRQSTHDRIKQAIDGVRFQIRFAEAQRAQGHPPPPEVGDLALMDVLTVRDRWCKKSPTLQDAVEAVWLTYRHIHCYFCRSPISRGAPPEEEHWIAENLLRFPH